MAFAKEDPRILTVTIDENGDMLYLATTLSDVLLEMGTVVQKRASHVLPVPFFRRQWFRVLRLAFGDKGRTAAWTRNWTCEWLVDPSPVGAPRIAQTFRNRQDAIDFEISYLNDWFLRR